MLVGKCIKLVPQNICSQRDSLVRADLFLNLQEKTLTKVSRTHARRVQFLDVIFQNLGDMFSRGIHTYAKSQIIYNRFYLPPQVTVCIQVPDEVFGNLQVFRVNGYEVNLFQQVIIQRLPFRQQALIVKLLIVR